jgi:hypothetical protein
MICRLFTQKSIHGIRTVYVTAVQPYKGTAPPVYPSTAERAPKKVGWQVENCFSLAPASEVTATKVETRLEHILCFQRQVGGQMAVWKRSLASPRLHSAVGSSPNYDASTGCSASLCTPLHCLVGLCRPPCRPRGRRRADHRMIRRWSQGVRTVKATRGFLLFISFRHRTALDGSGCFYGSRLTHKLEAAWSNQTYEDGDAPPPPPTANVRAGGTGAPCDGVLRNGRGGGIYCGRRQL